MDEKIMNIEEFRDYCLSLPQVEEKMPFGAFRWASSILAFYVGGKIFCFIDIEKCDLCTLKCDPSLIDGLKSQYSAVGRPFNMNPKYWIGVSLNEDVDDITLRSLIKASYEIVKTATRQG